MSLHPAVTTPVPPGQTPIDPLLRGRWSPRIFDPTHELTEADLARLLEAGRWAPSAGNSQPWAFIATLRGEPSHKTFVEALSRGNHSWAPDASALILTLHQIGDPEGPEFAFSDYALHDLGQASAHITLQAHSMGLFAHQFAGFDHDRLAEEFDVPQHFKVTHGIAIGRRATPEQAAAADQGLRGKEAAARRRRPLTEFVFGERYGVPRWTA